MYRDLYNQVTTRILNFVTKDRDDLSGCTLKRLRPLVNTQIPILGCNSIYTFFQRSNLSIYCWLAKEMLMLVLMTSLYGCNKITNEAIWLICGQNIYQQPIKLNPFHRHPHKWRCVCAQKHACLTHLLFIRIIFFDVQLILSMK